VHPIYKKPKMVAMATPLTGYGNICILLDDQLNPSIVNSLVDIIHTKPVIAILVPELVAMATPLIRKWISSSDSLNPKINP